MYSKRGNTQAIGAWRSVGALLVAFLWAGGCEGPGGSEQDSPVNKLMLVSGDEQIGTVGQGLGDPLVVEVQDEDGQALSGVVVTWSTDEGALSETSLATDGDGRASVEAQLGTVGGSYFFEATVKAAPELSVIFEATARAGEVAALEGVSGDEQTGVVGQPLGAPFVAKVTDQYGNAVEGIEVVWSAQSGEESAVTPIGDGETDEQGLVSAQATLGELAQSYTFRASLADDAGEYADFEVVGTIPPPGEFVLIPAGTVEVGCTDGQAGCSSGRWVTEQRRGATVVCADGQAICNSSESPSHEVTLTRDFFMGNAPVTQAEFEALMGYNPAFFQSPDYEGCPDCPVERVNWNESAAYANALSKSEGLEECYACTGSGTSVSCTEAADYEGEAIYECPGYRLPTEAEWEYAARCGTDYRYAGSDDLDEVGWYGSNSGSQTHPVGLKLPNACGLYDMSGNVWEWTGDWWNRTYTSEGATDPVHTSGSIRVIRGGSWSFSAFFARVSQRYGNFPGNRIRNLGFRLARTNP